MEFVLDESEWKMGNLRAFSQITYLDKIIEIIKEDKHACFFG
tara:strand:- start:717 stop:842 length:126 start_codon:yes stop_codon:yes gene_type:complete